MMLSRENTATSCHSLCHDNPGSGIETQMQPIMVGLWDMPGMKTLPKGDYLVCCHINNPVSLWGVDDTVRLYSIKEHMNYSI